MAAALIDASAMVAAFSSKQSESVYYQKLLRQGAQEHWSLSTTWPCVTEASYMVPPPQRYTLLRWLGAGAIAVYPFAQDELSDFADLMHRYTQAPRSEMDLADASLVWLAEQTGVTRIMTLDVRDFSRYRLADGRAFEIL